MIRTRWGCALLLPLLATSTAVARDGIGAQVSLPSGAFEETYERGYGLVGFFNIPVGSLATTGQMGVTRFLPRADTPSGQAAEEIHVWEFLVGAGLKLSQLQVGMERGYFTRVKEWDWVANAGIRLWRLDGSVRWKTFSDPSWVSFRIGYMF